MKNWLKKHWKAVVITCFLLVTAVLVLTSDAVINYICPEETDAGKAWEEIVAEMPDYVVSSAEAFAHKVSARQNESSFSFAFLSDAHIGAEHPESYQSANHAAQALRVINHNCKLDFVAHGGDYVWGSRGDSKEQTLQEFADYKRIFDAAAANAPNLYAVGNHDDLPYSPTGTKLTQSQVYDAIGKWNCQPGFVGELDCNYGYLDLESQKIRVIVIDSHDRHDWGAVDRTTYSEAEATEPWNAFFLNVSNVGAKQLRFIAEKALDLSGKSDPTQWTIVAFSHILLAGGNPNGTYTDPDTGAVYQRNTVNVPILFDAYNRRSSGTITHNGETVTYDFSQAGGAVACVVHGDAHNYQDNILADSILSVGCPNVVDGRDRVSADGNTYKKTPETEDGTSFCVITVDKENGKIYADHYGAGYDRQWDYIAQA